MSNAAFIYHMCRADEWQAALVSGHYAGSSQDLADGFIHFSTAAQIKDSAAKHRAGQTGLLLVAAAAADLGEALVWEEARGGALFPHLYGGLPVTLARWVKDLPVGADGLHCFPDLEA